MPWYALPCVAGHVRLINRNSLILAFPPRSSIRSFSCSPLLRCCLLDSTGLTKHGPARILCRFDFVLVYLFIFTFPFVFVFLFLVYGLLFRFRFRCCDSNLASMANDLRRVSALQTEFGAFASLKTLGGGPQSRACWNMMKEGLFALGQHIHGHHHQV